MSGSGRSAGGECKFDFRLPLVIGAFFWLMIWMVRVLGCAALMDTAQGARTPVIEEAV
jgi:hypothetical protein